MAGPPNAVPTMVPSAAGDCAPRSALIDMAASAVNLFIRFYHDAPAQAARITVTAD